MTLRLAHYAYTLELVFRVRLSQSATVDVGSKFFDVDDDNKCSAA